LEQVKTLLNERAQQYRSIQKRLLVRFKDKNAAPLQHLDFLLEDTFNQLMELGTTYEERENNLFVCANKLSCGTHLILLLIR
jgi:Bardet-Biedl syndrome 9 protein